jgi:hypothetical protein
MTISHLRRMLEELHDFFQTKSSTFAKERWFHEIRSDWKDTPDISIFLGSSIGFNNGAACIYDRPSRIIFGVSWDDDTGSYCDERHVRQMLWHARGIENAIL